MSMKQNTEPEVEPAFRRKKSQRHFGRYRQVASVLLKYRLDDFIKLMGLERYLPFHRLPPSFRRQTLSQAVRTRMALEELGTTFVKLGQILSTRTDILPKDYIQELSKLQNALRPIDFGIIKQLIQAELGKPTEEIFSTLDPIAVGVASIGQVHGGTLKDGQKIVIKVRKPGVYEQVVEDLNILRQLAKNAEEHWAGGGQYKITEIVEEVAEALMVEMDYISEGHNCEYFSQYFKDNKTIHIPRVYWEYTTRRVITLERMMGAGILETGKWAKPLDRKEMAERAFKIWADMVFYGEIFHADPHPGNLLVEPDGRLALLDFGMIGVMDEDIRTALASTVIAILNRDVDMLIDSLVEMGAVSHGQSRENLHKGLKHVLTHFRQLAMTQEQINSGLVELLNVVRENNVQLPSNTFLLLKTMGMAQSLARSLYPDFDVLRVLEPDVRTVIKRKNSIRALISKLPLATLNLVNFGIGFPSRLDRVMRSIESGDLQVRTDVSGVEEHLVHLETSINRLMIGFIIAAIIIAGAIIFLAFWYRR